VFAASVITLVASVLMLIGVSLGWRDIFTIFVFSTGLLVHPVLAYIGIRLMTRTGWAWRLFLASLASVVGLGLWAWAAYIVVHLRYT
jgi:hypothetical protein